MPKKQSSPFSSAEGVRSAGVIRMKARGFLVLLLLALLLIPACRQKEGSAEPKATEGFVLTSTAFEPGKRIPTRYTCDGEDLSPPLSWKGIPEGTRSLVLVVEDPDAPRGTFVHWIIYDIPPDLPGLPEGVPRQRELENGALQGINDFGVIGYRGPCPPPGKPHRYFFILRALDTVLHLDPGTTRAELEEALKGHVLGETKLMGTYGR